MSKKPELNYDQFNSVKVSIVAGAPGPVAIRSRNNIPFEDLSWNPFNKIRSAKQFLKSEKVFHEVLIGRNYLSDDGTMAAVSVLRAYYRRNPEKLRDADKLSDIERMTDQEVGYIVNTWIGIVKHFGPTAHYRREFTAMMRPVPIAFRVAGL